MTQNPIKKQAHLNKDELIALKELRIINNTAYVYFALKFEKKGMDIKEFAKRWNIPESSAYEAIAKLKKVNLLPEWVKVQSQEKNQVEGEIRDRLHQELGGVKEVNTAVGFIDLLTKTEIIEVKNIRDWKTALGQILAYSAYYPSHNKRIHLFGENLSKLVDIESACLPFGVNITGEEVEQ